MIEKLYWVGAGRFLIIYDAILLLIVACDIYRYKYTFGMSLVSAWDLSRLNPTFDLAFLIVFSIVVVSPVLITFCKYQIRGFLSDNLHETWISVRWLSLGVHFVVGILLLIAWYLVPYMEHLSGPSVSRQKQSFAFSSVLFLGVSVFNSVILGFVLANASKPFWDFTNSTEKLKHAWTAFSLWLKFAFPKSEYYPVYGSKLNFNAGGISPEIRTISKRISRKFLKYQKKIPGSRASKDYLQELFLDCAAKIWEVLHIDPDKRETFRIELYSGTSRAIEAAITRFPKPLVVIISPHEHFSEEEVSKWLEWQHALNNLIKVEKINFSAAEYQLIWNRQLRLIKEKLNVIISSYKDPLFQPNFVLIISEVSSITGMAIDIERLIRELNELSYIANLRGESRFHVLIDASHAVGNYDGAFDAGRLDLSIHDLYVFGAHKWLLSPEPMGVVIGVKDSTLFQQKPYDCWDEEDLPKTTVNVTSIASLLSCLEFQLESNNLSQIMQNSRLLKGEFLKMSDTDRFEIVSSLNREILSNMVSVKPRDGYRWKPKPDGSEWRTTTDKSEFQSFLATKGVIVEVIDADVFAFWVRLTFPYFATTSTVRRLKQKLNEVLIQD